MCGEEAACTSPSGEVFREEAASTSPFCESCEMEVASTSPFCEGCESRGLCGEEAASTSESCEMEVASTLGEVSGEEADSTSPLGEVIDEPLALYHLIQSEVEELEVVEEEA
ncbi:hypothetical protein AB1Y20_014662 [Prymnesium parvum]|uniref:Uncharacterized protein n=1 Tax=Prymnesium parvum TaxID=97485 RepID=A0AB34IE88_PRYPA